VICKNCPNWANWGGFLHDKSLPYTDLQTNDCNLALGGWIRTRITKDEMNMQPVKGRERADIFSSAQRASLGTRWNIGCQEIIEKAGFPQRMRPHSCNPSCRLADGRYRNGSKSKSLFFVFYLPILDTIILINCLWAFSNAYI
jgi:hypothetical protein